jgi:hypothetical protein
MANPSAVQSSTLSEDGEGELALLRKRLAALEQTQRDSDLQSRRRRNLWAAGAIGLALTAGTVAMAAPGDCPNGMPFCFAPDSPALAAQVNENFAHLRTENSAWVSGPLSSIPLNTGPRQVVVSVNVPAGSYVVAAKLYGYAASGGNLLCGLHSSGVASFLDSQNSHPTNNYVTVPLLGSATLATAGNVRVECQTQGTVPYTLYGVSLVATRVAALN